MRKDLETLKATGEVEALTICFVNAYINGDNEEKAAAIARDVFGDTPISVSSEVVPEMQEYERTETTVMNSYVRPEMQLYIDNLQGALNDRMGDDLLLDVDSIKLLVRLCDELDLAIEFSRDNDLAFSVVFFDLTSGAEREQYRFH